VLRGRACRPRRHDPKGFVRARADAGEGRRALETSLDVFAIGDVRSGSTKRVAAAFIGAARRVRPS